MNHDERCERVGHCRCEVRALEAKLAALRPLVRAALVWCHEWASNKDNIALERAGEALDPAIIAWAKGGGDG